MNLARVLILIVFFYSGFVAALTQRMVNLEWDADPDAVTYEIEIGHKGSQKSFSTQSDIKNLRWSGSLPPGQYWMRVRGQDDRGLSGDWSDASEFQVKLEAPAAISPLLSESIKNNQPKKEILFKWKEVADAKSYAVILTNEKGELLESKKVTKNSLAVNLAAAKKYFWSVQSADSDGALGEKITAPYDFVVEGAILPTTLLVKPESIFVREIKFQRPSAAENVIVTLKHFRNQEKDWETIGNFKVSRGTSLNFLSQWPGGRYQVTAYSHSNYHPLSLPNQITFDVAEGSRSLSAENKSLIRQSIDRTHDLFFQTSYVMSQVSYETKLISQNKTASVSALTGAVQVGAGYYFPNLSYGVYGSIEYGGILVADRKNTFLSVEAFGIYRTEPTRSSDLQIRVGLSQREIPEVINTTPTIMMGNAKLLGPAIGVEYWYSLSPKWAVQSAATTRFLVSGTSARGAKIDSSTSLNLGLMTAYKIHSGLSFLFGYNYRAESIKYSDTNVSFGVDGTSQTKMTGHYLQTTFEFDF